MPNKNPAPNGSAPRFFQAGSLASRKGLAKCMALRRLARPAAAEKSVVSGGMASATSTTRTRTGTELTRVVGGGVCWFCAANRNTEKSRAVN